ncbi:TetR/AcrR family transcriptional regulator [Desulfosediminicola flagellatus]|uniref:TetR/AcrR family transcriptional regulator n=1 Tax=Desulfosediminicola flagellatus TaxID=2569541 RepID=UPI0010ABFFED|nr:TetR/AcrR family transcriptional regulator [Desulfosediminicola flagellatus]
MGRVVKKPEERKSEIVAAACQLFLSKGYDSTTMKDVMVELNIAKGTIYHYFRSKEELLEAVILSVAEEEFLRLKKIFDDSNGTALERVRHLVIAGSGRHGDGHDEIIEHLHRVDNAGMHVRLLAQLVTMQAPLYAELFTQGCKEGVFTTSCPLEAAEFLLSGIQFLVDQGIYPWTDEQLLRRWKAFPALIESILQAPAGSFQFLHEIIPDG